MCITVIQNVMKIGKELALEAAKHGICEEWFDQMVVLEDKFRLLDMYVRGIDFCLSYDFPSNEYIAKHFKGQMEAFGVHLDESFNLSNDNRVVALGKCLGRVETNLYNTTQIFVKHESDLLIVAKGNAFVMIDLFDNSRIRVVASADAKVCVNRYGGELTVDKQERAVVKVIEKNKKTY